MAEQLQIRQVKLDDGTTLSFDGTSIVIDGEGSNPAKSAVVAVSPGDVDALVWLIAGRNPRRRGTGAKRTAKPKPPSAVVEPPAGEVPAP